MCCTICSCLYTFHHLIVVCRSTVRYRNTYSFRYKISGNLCCSLDAWINTYPFEHCDIFQNLLTSFNTIIRYFFSFVHRFSIYVRPIYTFRMKSYDLRSVCLFHILLIQIVQFFYRNHM